ncbi:MAG TPA: hypothetical protein VIG46_01410 [Candidatus Baltobacteraceae bacterium]|jgi:hypothetical protein
MEQNLVHLAESAAWVFLIIFIFAAIGVVATVRWIVAQLTRGERAVVAEAQRVGEAIHHHPDDARP